MISKFEFVGEYMNGVNKTLYIPLYGKAYVSKKGIILDDKKAEQMVNAPNAVVIHIGCGMDSRCIRV